MTTETGRIPCVKCNKEKATIRCGGCFEEFCYQHWNTHRQELNEHLDEIEMNHDIFRQTLIQHIDQPEKNVLIQQINLWEQNSIKIIQQMANETKQIIMKDIQEFICPLELKLIELSKQLRRSREENDFNEINLRQFQEELQRLTNELAKPSNITIQEDSTSFISKISVKIPNNSAPAVPIELLFESNIHDNTKWMRNGVTIAGGNGCENALNQFLHPSGLFVYDEQTIYITDLLSNRIMEWKCGEINGRLVAGTNGKGNQRNQLDWPTDVIVDRKTNNLIICDKGNKRIVQWSLGNGTGGETILSKIHCFRLTMDNHGYLYISDYKKHGVIRWKIGDIKREFVAGGNRKGNRLNQLNGPTSIFIGQDYSVYVSDCQNHRVMKWSKGEKEGIVVAGGHGQGNGLTQLSCPQGLIVDHLDNVYVADSDNHRIMRWYRGAPRGNIIIGKHGQGNRPNQLNCPTGISFDRQGNLYVIDCNNSRVQRFNIDQSEG